jgi:hypothetical protein
MSLFWIIFIAVSLAVSLVGIFNRAGDALGEWFFNALTKSCRRAAERKQLAADTAEFLRQVDSGQVTKVRVIKWGK